LFRQSKNVGWLIVPMLIGSMLVPLHALAVPIKHHEKKTVVKKAMHPVSSDSDVVATVNGEKITRAQVVNEIFTAQMAGLKATNPMFKDRQRPFAGSVGALVLLRMAANGGKPVTISREDIVNWLFKDKPDVLASTVNQMIQEVLVEQAAKKEGIVVTPQQLKNKVEYYINMARNQFNMTGKTDDQVLASVGATRSYLTRLAKIQMLAEKLVLKDIETKLGHPIGPDDFVEASHILVPLTPNPFTQPGAKNPPANETKEQEYAAAKEKIDAIRAQIMSGKMTFEQAAEANNPDSTRAKGGSLGVFMRGEMVPSFDKVVFSLKQGEISEPVKTQFGWHLIRVDKLGKNLTQAQRDKALQEMIEGRINAKIAELESEAKITNTVKPPAAPTMMMPASNQ